MISLHAKFLKLQFWDFFDSLPDSVYELKYNRQYIVLITIRCGNQTLKVPEYKLPGTLPSMMHLSTFISVDDGVPKASISAVNTFNDIPRWFREIKRAGYK